MTCKQKAVLAALKPLAVVVAALGGLGSYVTLAVYMMIHYSSRGTLIAALIPAIAGIGFLTGDAMVDNYRAKLKECAGSKARGDATNG